MSKVIVDIDPELLSQFDGLSKDIKKKFKKRLGYLKENPQHKSLQIHRIQGTDFWEFYVDKGYRCVFKRDGAVYKLYFLGSHELIDNF
jgi:mRNA-degrading endonuclease RelE of RelBE toxin-antitoxin system